MTYRRRPSGLTLRATRRAPEGASWMALLASTTLGVEGSTVRASVRTDLTEIDEAAEYRLVVQSYDGSMRHGARPVGSVQRIVRGADLRRGVDVSLVELRDAARTNAKALVVAWIDAGKADLEYDARGARPQPGSIFGASRSGSATVLLTLSRKVAGSKPKLAAA